ncbi:hypothetical protein [uncultured Aquimarina sp.]|uniref:hypothetical protein n=1 Tax=uncultured Aquimarina sp. TaxID=575652 RepID=UPI00260662B2|nr:hypothetical protein [uncultured Aquimarina sp.]
MKTKKVIWGLLISLITISCSTDDSIVDKTQNLENTINITNKSWLSSDTVGEGGEEEGEIQDYGMPFDNSYEGQDFIIEVIYITENDEIRVDVRRKFSEKHPDLVLVQVATTTSEIEQWFLKSLDGRTNSRGAQDLPEEDDDPTQSDEFVFEYINILSEIRQDPRIRLHE